MESHLLGPLIVFVSAAKEKQLNLPEASWYLKIELLLLVSHVKRGAVLNSLSRF